MNHHNRSASWLWVVAILAVYFQEHGQGLTSHAGHGRPVLWAGNGQHFRVDDGSGIHDGIHDVQSHAERGGLLLIGGAA